MTGANWWVDAFPASVPGGAAYGGGGGADMLTARDPLDARRMAEGFAPGASYPDGYLGSITDRREDKLAFLQNRPGPGTYQRGVHVGDRVDPAGYFWDQDMNPQMGLARQDSSVPDVIEGGLVFLSPRAAPTGSPVERLAHDGKTAMEDPRGQENALRQAGGDPAATPVQVMDPSRRARMARELPAWSGVWQA